MEQLTVIKGGQLQEANNINIDMFNRFIEFSDATEKTIETYTKSLRQLFNYLTLHNISQPQREDIIHWKDELKATGHKPTTIQSYLSAARVFFRWTAEEGLYPNIADHIKGVKLDRGHKKDYLATQQAKSVLTDVSTDRVQGKRDYAILVLMLTCGLRTIEISRANIEDLKTVGDNAVLYVQGKGHEEKTDFVKLDTKVEAAIREYLKERKPEAETEPLFSSTSNNSKGKRLSTRTISGIAKDSLRAAGYDSPRLTAHSFRHTAVTLALLSGKPLEEVSQFARHADISTTLIYAHHLDKAKNSCSEAVAAAVL